MKHLKKITVVAFVIVLWSCGSNPYSEQTIQIDELMSSIEKIEQNFTQEVDFDKINKINQETTGIFETIRKKGIELKEDNPNFEMIVEYASIRRPVMTFVREYDNNNSQLKNMKAQLKELKTKIENEDIAVENLDKELNSISNKVNNLGEMLKDNIVKLKEKIDLYESLHPKITELVNSK